MEINAVEKLYEIDYRKDNDDPHHGVKDTLMDAEQLLEIRDIADTNQRDAEVLFKFWEVRKSIPRDKRAVYYLAVSMLIQAARDILYVENYEKKFGGEDNKNNKKVLSRSVIEDRKRSIKYSKEASLWIKDVDSGVLSFSFCCFLLGIHDVKKAKMGFLENLNKIADIEMPNTGDPIMEKASKIHALDFLISPNDKPAEEIPLMTYLEQQYQLDVNNHKRAGQNQNLELDLVCGTPCSG